MSGERIAVIGAGVAGLVCARRLSRAGHGVTVFEKSRGLGGRMATRRRDGLQFDHGAPWLRASSRPAGELLAAAKESGAAKRWAAAPDGVDGEDGEAFVGLPGMSDLARPMAEGLDVRVSTEVAGLSREGRLWRLDTGNAGEGPFDRVILAVPAPQTARLCADAVPGIVEEMRQVEFAPCYTLMAAFDDRPGWPDATRAPSADLALLLRDSAKPGRPGGAECWVVHASEAWSRANLEMERSDAADAILDLLRAAMGETPPIRAAFGHRWRYSQVARPLGRDHLSSDDGTLLVGGDWTLGRTLDDAARSGDAMASAVLG